MEIVSHNAGAGGRCVVTSAVQDYNLVWLYQLSSCDPAQGKMGNLVIIFLCTYIFVQQIQNENFLEYFTFLFYNSEHLKRSLYFQIPHSIKQQSSHLTDKKLLLQNS